MQFKESHFFPGYLIDTAAGTIVHCGKYKSDTEYKALRPASSHLQKGYYVSVFGTLHNLAKVIYEQHYHIRVPPQTQFVFNNGNNMDCGIDNIEIKTRKGPGRMIEWFDGTERKVTFFLYGDDGVAVYATP